MADDAKPDSIFRRRSADAEYDEFRRTLSASVASYSDAASEAASTAAGNAQDYIADLVDRAYTGSKERLVDMGSKAYAKSTEYATDLASKAYTQSQEYLTDLANRAYTQSQEYLTDLASRSYAQGQDYVTDLANRAYAQGQQYAADLAAQGQQFVAGKQEEGQQYLGQLKDQAVDQGEEYWDESRAWAYKSITDVLKPYAEPIRRKSSDALQKPRDVSKQEEETEKPAAPGGERAPDKAHVEPSKREDEGEKGSASPKAVLKAPERATKGDDKKVKFGYEEVRTIPPDKKPDKHDFNARVEGALGKLVTKLTSSKESVEYIESLMKEAHKDKIVSEAPTVKHGHDEGALFPPGKSTAKWAATPAEAIEYEKFQDHLKKCASADKVEGKKGAEPPKTASGKEPAKSASKEGPKKDKGGEPSKESHKGGSKSPKDSSKGKGGPKSPKGPRKDEGSPKGPPLSKESFKDKGPPENAAKRDKAPPEKGKDDEDEAEPKKSCLQRVWKFCRWKPADEESSAEAAAVYPEMDEECIEVHAPDTKQQLKPFKKTGWLATLVALLKGRRTATAAPPGEPPGEFKLNAAGVSATAAVVFITLLVILLSGELADDLDRSVRTFDVDLRNPTREVDEAFLGATLDSSILGEPAAWGRLVGDPDARLLTLARGLAPAVLRFSGYETNHFYFVEEREFVTTEASKDSKKPLAMRVRARNVADRFPLTAADWLSLTNWTAAVGWKLLFSLNLHCVDPALEQSDVLRWNLNDAAQLLRFHERHNLSQVLWQLGHEPDLSGGLTPYALGNEYASLHQLLVFFPESSTLVGPGVSTIRRPGIRFLRSFLKGRGKYVDVISLQHTIHSTPGPKLSLDDYLDALPMEKFIVDLLDLDTLLRNVTPRAKPVWLTSLGPARGGPTPGVSGTFASGFQYLDALGVAARLGVSVVLRDSLLRGDHPLIDSATARPNPDYWLTLLFRKVVGFKVLRLDQVPIADPYMRVYAHCSSEYKGGLVLFGVNLNNYPARLKKKGTRMGWETQLRYVLTSDPIAQAKVFLNGNLLSWDGGPLPILQPDKMRSTIVKLPPLALGFFVFPEVNAAACA